MNRLKELYLKQKGYFYPVGKKWDNDNLSPENIHCYVEKVLEYETERFRDGKPTKEYILASSGETINENLRRGINNYIEILEVFDNYKVKEDITVYRTVSTQIYNLMEKNAKKLNGVHLFEVGILHTSLIKGCELKGSGYKLRIKVKKGTPAFYVGNLTDEESYYYEVILVNNIKLISINYCYYIFIKFLISKITYIALFFNYITHFTL
ncbi:MULTISPECIES: ADP-ribosyltransferase [Staphylococcus]|uniref:ADP-ribosyltransferase n=1 Tax=Staphylococcus TaxID=1279 RepID=UPI0009F34272|nr:MULTISPECIES: ADP-ribosyltransferase [Staphylococcus]MCC2082987.1 ADP-ribosyltransferase [Staphylococcus lugdunensis]MCH8679683.1 ADP-ribosyltransferase [Staphylococcus lugdunensis]MCI2828079.1 ADP-ribosyltransferase [Staphylococcus lugdunensis]MCI2835528.1 ADP-ribosyltransferase [Staphylococcus lugdunensis]MCM3466551.1 ADP-ribosyltransferase [Staphylococcus lugdunensis]